MIDVGILADDKVELLRGFIVRMSPQNARHAFVVQRLTRFLVLALADRGAVVRVQLPLALGEDSEPEPDAAVVPAGDYRDEHPSTALLIVEVAGSSLANDLGEKARLYAAAGIAEYWVVDIEHDLVVIHTDVVANVYNRVTPCRSGDLLTPRAFPDVSVPVREILG
ncbi:MAG TPA: Uma2 family endonuclease [Polyangia bacterium]|nr:Uma2 family endonuclease [Polyangia bacterium]